MATTTWLRAGSGMVALAALALTACAPEEAAEFQEGGSASSPQPDNEQVSDESGETNEPETADAAAESSRSDDGEDVLIAEVDDPVTFEECEEAEESDEATVTWLEDRVVEEQEIAEPIPAWTEEIDGDEIEFPGAPGIVIPERVGQAGCIIEYDAPGRCLPAVEISGAYIPGYHVSGREIPAVELPDGSEFEELTQDGLSAEPAEIAGDRAEQVCQSDGNELEEGDVVSPVSRGPISRGPISQGPDSTGPESNGPTSLGESGYISGYSMTGYSAPGTSVSGASVSGDSLSGYVLEGSEGTERADLDETTSYTTEGDVLFDSDEYELRGDAAPELEAIADDIGERDDDYVIEVEGHTDDLPTSVYDDNYELSGLRAESVVDWLVDNADVDEDRISAEGLGEDYPRTDNDSDEGRQQNRRVVITVQPQDYEPEVDYELEDAEE